MFTTTLRLSLLGSLFLVQGLVAATYYVDDDGSDSNDGSIGAPWKTIKKALGVPYTNVVAGDTVYLRTGIYTTNSSSHMLYITGTNLPGYGGPAPSGTAEAPITLAAYPGETPILGNIDYQSASALFMNDVSYYVFDGLTFSNCSRNAWIVDCTNLVFKNCTFGWMNTNGGQYDGLYFDKNCQMNTVSNCLFYKWGMVIQSALFTTNAVDIDADTIYVSSTSDNSPHTGTKFVLGATNPPAGLTSGETYYCRFVSWIGSPTYRSTLKFALTAEDATNNNCIDITSVGAGMMRWSSPFYANDHGVNIALGSAANDWACYYNLIVSNQFFWGGHDNFKMETAYNVIRGNLFVNAPWEPTNEIVNTIYDGTPNPYGAYGNRQTKPGDTSSGLGKIDQRNVYEYNRFLYTGPPPDDNGAHGIELCTVGSIYRFNEICYSIAAGIFLNLNGVDSGARSNSIYGNTFFGNGLNSVFGGAYVDGAINMSNGEGYWCSNNLILNNIMWSNPSTNMDWTTRSHQIMLTNWNQDDGVSYPMFVNTNGWGYVYDSNSLPNFHLQAGSPAIDKGGWLTYTTNAGSGTTLPLTNSLPFSDGNRIVTGDTIQLQGQTTRVTVTSNDWQNNILYLSGSLTWTNGQGVSVAYAGTAPDMGAYEYLTPTNRANITNLRVKNWHIGGAP